MIDLPNNVDLAIPDEVNISVPEESVDIAYSHQLTAHLRPDDTLGQLGAIFALLLTVFLALTTSLDFDEVVTGFHLRRYSVDELFNQFGITMISLCKSNSHLRVSQLSIFLGLVNLFRLSEWALDLLLGRVLKASQSLILSYEKSRVPGGFKTDP